MTVGAAAQGLPPAKGRPIIGIMVATERILRKPCRLGLAAARAAQAAVEPDIVILFGSRARGDHRPDSDIDLLVVHAEGRSWAVAAARRAGYARLQAIAPHTAVNAIGLTRPRFAYARRAKNHVAAQALRDGVVMNGEKLDGPPEGDDEYPVNWPDIKERLQAAHRNLAAFDYLISNPAMDQEIYGFHAQQAVENALKGWLSAADLDYDRSHARDRLAAPLLAHPAEGATAAAEQLRRLLEYTAYYRIEISGNPQTWLTRYAAEYRYSGARYHMDDLEKARFQEEIQQTVHASIARIHRITGTDAGDWQGV